MAGRIGWILSLLIAFLNDANAFKEGPGSCNAGIPLQGAHLLNEQLGGGPLSDNGFEVQLNGTALDSESTNNVPISQDGQELQLVATAADTFFRGFLIRIEGENVDTRDYLDVPEGDENIQVVSLCVLIEEVGGVAHTNNTEKTKITSLLRIVEPTTDLTMDVTMVVQNRDGQSEWYNSRYILNAVDVVEGQPASTIAPTASAAPSSVPTTSPMPSMSPGPTTIPKPTSNGARPTLTSAVTSSPSTDSSIDTTAPSVSPLEESTSSGNTSSILSWIASPLLLVLATLWM
jgi:hypothetical protein